MISLTGLETRMSFNTRVTSPDFFLCVADLPSPGVRQGMSSEAPCKNMLFTKEMLRALVESMGRVEAILDTEVEEVFSPPTNSQNLHKRTQLCALTRAHTSARPHANTGMRDGCTEHDAMSGCVPAWHRP